MNLPPYGDQFRRTNSHFSALKVMPSPDPDMFVTISPGGFWLSNKIWKEFVGGRSPGFTAPTNNAKWDLLCLHYNGNPMIIPGIPGTDPVLPDLQRKAFPLAAIYLEPGDTKITSEKIFDLRFFNSTSFSHVDFEDLTHVDSHPIDAITGLREELDTIESGDYWSNVLASKADIDGTPSESFTLNKDFTGTPSSDCSIIVERGTQPNAEFKFNETLGQWEYTNNGTDWVQLTDQGPSVVIPFASSTVLGGVKIGSRLTIDGSGILSSDIQSTNDFSNAYKDKLNFIEPYATQDMTPLEIKASYESNSNTNAFSDTEKTKLAGIEDGATAGAMSNADVKTAYEANANTNAFTDAEKSKLLTVESNAAADMSAAEIKSVYESNSNTNAYTDAEKTKLSGIATSANNYVHPISHPPSIIVQDTNNRFVSDAEKTVWGSKADPNNYWSKTELSSTSGTGNRVDWSHLQNVPTFGSEKWLEPVSDIAARDSITNPQSSDCVLVQDDGDGKAAQYVYNGSSWVKIGDVDWSPMTDEQVKIAYENNSDTNVFTDSEKTKLGTIENDANNFTLEPAASDTLGGIMVGTGLDIDPSGLLSLNYVFDDSAHGVRGGGNLHQIATTSLGGFMSSGDKVKLDGIQPAANAYSLPVADDTTLGGVMIGDGIDILYGAISVDWSSLALDDTMHGVRGGGDLHSLATNSVNGFMSSIDKTKLDGVEDGANNYVLPAADDTTLGGVMIGDGINMSYGEISVDWSSLPVADDVTLGGVMIGDGINMLYGAISVDWSAMIFDDSLHGTRSGGNLHSLATDVAHGFMSTIDKTKLDGIEEGANAYSLPVADDTTLGGVMIGDGINMSYGEISVDWSQLPVADDTTLGGVMIGDGINMSYGEISVDWSSLPVASDTTLGGVMIGDGIDMLYGAISVIHEASITNYTVNQPSDWIVVPTSVSQAIDELASRIKSLEQA
jgi:hypothetical protein